jgi:hypothetical protein
MKIPLKKLKFYILNTFDEIEKKCSFSATFLGSFWQQQQIIIADA